MKPTQTDLRRLLRVAGLAAALLGLAACDRTGTDSDRSIDPEEAAPTMTDTPISQLADDNAAPIAEKRPVEITQLGRTRVDNYGWLRDDNWQEVLRDPAILRGDIRAQLEAENAYYERATAGLGDLRARLLAEMRGRVKEDDRDVPAPHGQYAYSQRYREGGQYAIHVRTPRNGGAETILYDGDLESRDADFFNVADVAHSPDHSMIAYAVDRTGSEYFDIRVRTIATGEEFDETVASTDGHPAWAADSRSFFYTERDDNQRPKWVKRHYLGTDSASDVLVYEETDDTLFLGVEESQSGKYIFIVSGKGSTSVARYLRTDAPREAVPTLIAPLVEEQQYYPEHHGDHFYMRTNAGAAVDFKIVRAPIDAPGRENWEDWLPHRPGTYVVDFVPFAGHIARLERENALPRIVISAYTGDESYELEFEEAAYSLGLDAGYEFETDALRFTYESPSTPEQTYDHDMTSRERTLRKSEEIPSGHDASLYTVERLAITAEDGAEIPVTVLRLTTTPVDGTSPLFLYGYGSYGITIPAGFDITALPLVDRGVIHAIAHVRGGSAKGRQWYLDARLENKINSFTDFARVAEELQERGYGRPGETVIEGRSAGGLLVGATVNLRPDLFAGVVAGVPFVDVLNTMSDAGLPLTPPEWVEWGNPIEDAAAYETIASYSPYDNIRGDLPYPPILATGGIADYRVTYWEPAKWIARLREEARGGPFLLKMNMEAGHAGSAARFERLEERAHDYAFALAIFGLTERDPAEHAPR